MSGKLTTEELQQIGERFLLSRYPRAKIIFDKANLTANGSSCCLEGKIKMPWRNPFLYLLSPLLSPPEQYSFKIKIDIVDGTILDWELK